MVAWRAATSTLALADFAASSAARAWSPDAFTRARFARIVRHATPATARAATALATPAAAISWSVVILPRSQRAGYSALGSSSTPFLSAGRLLFVDPLKPEHDL